MTPQNQTSLNKLVYIGLLFLTTAISVWYMLRFKYDDNVPEYLGYIDLYGYLTGIVILTEGLIKSEFNKKSRLFLFIPVNWFFKVFLFSYLLNDFFKFLDKYYKTDIYNKYLEVNKVIWCLIITLCINFIYYLLSLHQPEGQQ